MLVKKCFFLLLLALAGLQSSVNAQAPILQKNDILSNLKLRTWYGFNTLHSTKVLDVERVISENEFKELKTLRPFWRDTLDFQVEMTDIDGTQKIVNVSLMLSSEFMVAVEAWNTACGFPNGKVIVYIDGGVTLYHIMIWRNSDNQKLLDIWTTNSRVELLNLKPGGYKVIVDDSNTPVPNNYTLFNAVVGASSSPEVSLTPTPAPCGQNGKIESFTTKGVGPYTYLWSNGAITKDLLNVPAGTYTLTVSDANFCTDVATAKVEGTNGFVLALDAQNASCRLSNGSIVSTTTGGAWPFVYQWSNGATTKDLLNLPAGNYAVTVTDALGCKQMGMKTIFAKQRKDSFYINISSCNPKDTGTFFLKDTISFRTGCDSVTFKKVGYSPNGDRILETATIACKSYEHRIDTFIGKNIHGCDSVHFTSWLYEGVRTRYLPTRDTCYASPDHIDTLKSLMCADDSIYYVTHFRVLPKDTIRQTMTWCEPRQNDTVYFTNQFGCESLRITLYAVKRIDTTYLNFQTCDPAKAGRRLDTLQSAKECDSIVATNWKFVPVVVKRDTQRVWICGLSKTITREYKFQNSEGCDSAFLRIDSLAPAKATTAPIVFEQTCDPSQAGEFRDTIPSRIHGCDSLITVRRVRYTAPSTRTTNLNTCDQAQAGIRKGIVYSRIGCDSLYLDTIITYRGSAPTTLSDSIVCGSKNSVIPLVWNLKNQYGCDSVVTQKLITFESPKLKVDASTHPTSKWNGSIDLSVSKGTSPWTLYDGNGNEVPWEQYDKKGGLYPFVVVDSNGCWDSLAVGLSDFWAYTSGRVIHLRGGLADDELVNDYYGGEEVMIEVYDGQSLLETRKIQNIRLEFDLTFPKLTTTGVYYFRMVFPNRPGHYLVTKAVIQ